MGAKILAKGLLSWVPGLHRAFIDSGSGTASADYCYGVWIKHLTLLWAHGMAQMPRSVVELGPGSSIGTGLAALLSGAERYVGIDAVAFATAQANVATFRELSYLFQRRAPRPRAGFPAFDQYLDDRLFPSRILTDERLAAALAPARLERLERAVQALASAEPDPAIRYCTWSKPHAIQDGEVDLVFSHVVMNQVDDLAGVYGHCGRWVRPGGWMSHQIDFTSLGTTTEWNGHRRYGDTLWKVMSGRREYFINRELPEGHLGLMRRNGFEVVEVIRGGRQGTGLAREQLAPRWRGASDEDLRTQTAFVIARKR